MHILLLAKKPPYPARDGEAIAVMQMALGLSEAGHSVTLLYQNTDKHHFPVEDIPAEISAQIEFHAVEHDTPVTISGLIQSLFVRTPYHVKRFHSAAYHAKVRALTAGRHFDVVQAEGLYLTQYLAGLSRNTKTIHTYRSHNLEHEIWQNVADNSTNPLKKWYLRHQSGKLKAYEAEMIRQVADAVIPISTTDAAYYRTAMQPVPVHHAPTGIDIADPASMVIGEGLYFIGGLDWLPNREGLQWFMEEVWPVVHEALPQLQMEIAGRNAPDGFAADLPEGIFFNGEVPDAAAFAYDKAICVVPLLSGSGMKIKIAEALASGKVVVTTSKGAKGMPEGMANYLHIADTPEEFAGHIIRLAQQPDATHAAGMLGQRFILETLSNRAITGRLIQFYQTLLQR